MLDVWCYILIKPAATATAFSLANYTTLQCRIGQLVQVFPMDIDVGKPDLFESWGWGYSSSLVVAMSVSLFVCLTFFPRHLIGPQIQ